jgi:hypothetical protein
VDICTAELLVAELVSASNAMASFGTMPVVLVCVQLDSRVIQAIYALTDLNRHKAAAVVLE